MSTVPELFGSMVFDDRVMRARLSADVYRSLRDTMNKGKKLDLSVANAVADAMCAWAVENGATHFTHWFQPLTGITAEKHDGFISPAPDSHVIMKFSGKELITGEPDASSFPSGGLRATFEARGYTAWDPTSYAFIKEKTLCIPTAFCSYGGEALDKKTPLLRSMEALNREALRVLHLFGNADVKHVVTNVGPEQEYFLVDREMYLKRKDLIYTGRTLFGAMPPKGQELDDHYFGAIKPRVKAFMEELNEELWKLGIYAKTEHNEVAPCQHELAPIFTVSNIASDHNQLTMEIMKKVARKHGMVCLLHEKPFAGVNGSGKHNNFSLQTDGGRNLLDPGREPQTNTEFLLFMTAVLRAVDEYAPLLRLSAATPGNDHRLGGDEAPPAILSVFLGDQLTAVAEHIIRGSDEQVPCTSEMSVGVSTLPHIRRDATDRNRTSPFAFTGNKFEFRMVPSTACVADANTVLCTIVADALCDYADQLEKEADPLSAVPALLQRELTAHQRIIFNGNGYTEDWVAEAERRGLPNIRTMVDAIPAYLAQDTAALFARHGVYTSKELAARADVAWEQYAKVINIEALTMIDMAGKDILPAVVRWTGKLAQAANEVAGAGVDASVHREMLERVCILLRQATRALSDLEEKQVRVSKLSGAARAAACRDELLPAMTVLRAPVDLLEGICDAALWPIPGYDELLFNV